MSQRDYNPDSVDAVLSRIETKLNDVLGRMEAQDKRVGVLEKWRYWMLGASAAASGTAVKLWKVIEGTGIKPPSH